LESFDNYDANDVAANKGLAAVSYLNPVFIIIALLANPNSRYLRFHINQALLLSLYFIACAVVSVIPVLGWIGGGAGAVAGIVFMIIGMVNAYQGTDKELPVIGSYRIIH
jgi:uncharacterized membrane protein